MSLTKEQLLTVNGLSGKVNDMSNSQFDEYSKKLFTFIEGFPDQEAKLRKSFAADDYSAFSEGLIILLDVLEKIHASGLMQSCRRLLEEFLTQKYNIVEAHLNYLLAEISALSIDIQMMQHAGDDPAQAVAPPVRKAEAQAVPKSILAVDDVSFLLMGLKLALQNTDYKLTGVTSGEAALRYVSKHTPDLFILDIEMPGMNGYELTRELRKRGQKAPVIFLTGNATMEYVQKAIEVGAVDFIVKPINKAQVLEKIMKHIS